MQIWILKIFSDVSQWEKLSRFFRSYYFFLSSFLSLQENCELSFSRDRPSVVMFFRVRDLTFLTLFVGHPPLSFSHVFFKSLSFLASSFFLLPSFVSFSPPPTPKQCKLFFSKAVTVAFVLRPCVAFTLWPVDFLVANLLSFKFECFLFPFSFSLTLDFCSFFNISNVRSLVRQPNLGSLAKLSLSPNRSCCSLFKHIVSLSPSSFLSYFLTFFSSLLKLSFFLSQEKNLEERWQILKAFDLRAHFKQKVSIRVNENVPDIVSRRRKRKNFLSFSLVFVALPFVSWK